MNVARELKVLAAVVGVFLLFYFLPLGEERFRNAVFEALYLARWYAREHVILCLVPAFFIAGAIAVFVSDASVMRYLGAGANKFLAYGVASVSGTVLAVCSCTVLPLFAGIYRMGAGLGPAATFLYAGPAINVLAIILTARVLGFRLGAARAVGAIVFSIVLGLLMHVFFLSEERERSGRFTQEPEEPERPLWANALFFAAMVGVLVFANWGEPAGTKGVWAAIYSWRWVLAAASAGGLAAALYAWFEIPLWKVAAASVAPVSLALAVPSHPVLSFAAGAAGLAMATGTSPGRAGDWLESTWDFAKLILPLLFIGVLAAGALLGRPREEALIPSEWVKGAVGGNSLRANFSAALAGALMYFATLTEVPILQGLIGSGMGKGPALALLLAGPAVSLPNLLVIRSILGTRKTLCFVGLVVLMSTAAGLVFGAVF